jgi:hypothetical protein
MKPRCAILGSELALNRQFVGYSPAGLLSVSICPQDKHRDVQPLTLITIQRLIHNG